MCLQSGRRKLNRMDMLAAAQLHEQSLVMRCLAHWSNTTRSRAPHRQEVATRVQATICKHRLVMVRWAWSAWQEWHVQRKIYYWALHRANGHYYHTVQALALVSWKTSVRKVILQRRSVQASLHHWRSRRLRSCMLSWHAWVAQQCVPPPRNVLMSRRDHKIHGSMPWPRCRRAVAKAVLHRLKQLQLHGMRAFKRNAARRSWKRKELLVAQEMHDNVLMDTCTRHLVSLGMCKLQLDIGRRTKALADGLQLAAPYALHWLLKTRHRLQTSNAKHHRWELGQENHCGNNAAWPTRPKPASAVKHVPHDGGRQALSFHASSTQDDGAFTVNSSQRRRLVRPTPPLSC